MPSSLLHPVTVTHQGMSILFVAEPDAAGANVIYYNVLDSSRGNTDNNLDWTGYTPLEFPTQVASLGISIGRVTRAVSSHGLFQVVSDQEYVYLFRGEGNSIYANRYRLVPLRAGNVQGINTYRLQSAWEVRYQRSGKADLAASDKDTPNAKSLDGEPYLEPIYELPLGFSGVDLSAASFSVTLEATTQEGQYRWQFFVPNPASKQIAAYSFAQTSEGWFLIDPKQISEENRTLIPDAHIELKHEGETLIPAGPLSATNYYRQEPILTGSSTVLQMKRAVRTFLAAPVTTAANELRLATIDFGVSVDGLLAGLQPDSANKIVQWEVGLVQPVGSMLSFDGASAVKINPGATSGPLFLPQTFTMEGWVNPSAATLDQQFVIGGDIDTPIESQAPSLWIEHRMRVGASFGDGTKLVRNITRDNVLTIDAWNHIAAVHDSAGFRIFINGFEVPLAEAQTPAATPASTPVSAIAAMAQWVTDEVRGSQVTASARTEKEYEGLMDEVRIWSSALTQSDIQKFLFKEIPAEEAKNMANLQGYWRFDEGAGSVTSDLSQYERNGTVSGARWESATSPVLPEDDARTYFDSHGLTTVVGLLVPTEEIHPNFGRIAAQSRVSLLEGADGLLHLYFKGATANPDQQGTFFGAQFDTNIARAYYGLPWIAGAGNPPVAQNGTFAFVARGTGSAFNNATVEITASNHPLLCDVKLNDGHNQEETWRGVPRRLDGLVSALNGNSTSQPTDRRLLDGTKRFYDYRGNLPIGAVAVGGTDTAHGLWFLSAHVGPFALRQVKFDSSAPDSTLNIVIASDAAHPEEKLQRTLKNVPSDTAAFVLTVSGNNPNYNYSAAANPGEPRIFSIPARPTPIAVFAPDASITAANITVSPVANGDPLLCNVEINLNPSGSQIAATWTNMPRSSAQLIAEMYASTDPAQKKVMGFVRIMNPGSTRAVNGVARGEAGVIPFLAALVLVNDGVSGSLTPFNCETAILQGATSNTASFDLRNGSALFAVATSAAPTNGYPQIVDFGNQGKIKASLLKAGVNGGWLDEPPRYAIRIHEDGFLSADAANPSLNVLAVERDLTLEAWARMVDTPPDNDLFFPRILQFVNPDQDRANRYMLGMGMTSTLQFQRATQVAADDYGIPDKSAELRLFPGSDYSFQFYIRPDLSTPSAQNVLYTRATSTGSIEKLVANKDGSLLFRIEPAGQQPVESSGTPSVLKDKEWQLVTVTRSATQLSIYINTALGQTIPSPPAINAPGSRVTVGGNDVALPLQFRMNEFSLWRRALTPEEIAAGLWRSLACDAAGLQLLWGMDNGSGTDLSVPNAAIATQGYYDTVATGRTTFWNYPGVFYRAYFGCRDLAVQTRDAVAAPGEWHHYAGLYECKYGIELDGDNYADCGNDGSLNVRNGVSVESWIWPSTSSSSDRQAVVSKYGLGDSERSYELGITRENKPYFQVRIDGQRTPSGSDAPERLRLKTFTAPNIIPANRAAYIVGTANIVTTADYESSQSVYSLAGQIYLNGQPQIPGPEQIKPANTSEQTYELQVLGGTGSGRYKKGTVVNITANDPATFVRWRGQTSIKDPNTPTQVVSNPGEVNTTATVPGQDVIITAIGVADQISITQSNTPLNLGRALSGSANAATAYFNGGISDARLWSRALSPASIAQAYALKAAPSGTNGLVSAWNFREQQGNVAYDSNGTNNATLSSSRLWTVFHDAAQLVIYVDGEVVPLEASLPGIYGAWGPVQFRVGGYQDEFGAYRDPFLGTLDELRVWKQQRTLEQINDNLYRYLKGSEAGLVGYWRFDAGSGRIIGDETVNGNNLIFQAATPDNMPEWTTSDAPISNEAPIVQNAVGNFRTPYVIDIGEGPAVFEYPDTETDAYGQIFSVMKRGYAYVEGGVMRHLVGYLVGDLRRVYIGQIQIKPSLIGYVEGAPPLPSENLTRPYYLDPIAMYFTYEGISTVTLTEKAGTDAHFSTLRKDQQGVTSNLKAGLSGDEKVYNGIQVPMGPVIMYQEVKYEWEAVIANELEWSQASSSGAGVSASVDRDYEISVKNGGAWEEADKVLLASGERRWIPSNVGTAVVKSATADMYGLYLPLTGALVGLSIVPNKDIPVDVNLIYFPINPAYVRNGSLDGRVGLQDDPSCLGNPSYFRPTEAYSLQRNIELQTAQLDAWYQQFNPSDRAKNQNSDLSDAVANSPFYDWSNRVPKKDMINKYVWAAGGGLYKEQESYSSHRTETYGGDFDFSWKLGPAADLKFDLGPVGLHFELEVLGGTGWTVTVDKDKDQESALELEVDIEPETFLGRFLTDAQPPFFSEDPVPGKVDTYRFATYYLAPKPENTADFLSKVVDQEWLELSTDPRAAALREVRDTGEDKSSWRVMHRVTFVSRVPPSFQAVPVESQAPPLADPPRLDENDLLIRLAQLHIGEGTQPTPPQIGAAVRTVYMEDLSKLLPWWSDFLKQAAQPNTDEQKQLQQIITDSLTYLSEYYAVRGSQEAATALTRQRLLHT